MFDDAIETLSDGAMWLRLGGAVLLAVMTVVVGRWLQHRLQPRLTQLRTPSFGSVFSRLAQAAVVTFGLFVAVTIVFPSVNAATALGSLGVLSIAAGFAFQDILSNLLAGILLIFRQPFIAGDQVIIGDVHGTVEEISVRETRVRTFAGHLVVIPNADVYSGVIDVQTDQERVRTDLAVGVGYDSDLGEARRLALATIVGVEGVLAEPAPEIELVGFGGSSMDFMVRYWTDSRQASVRHVKDRVIEAIYVAFNEAGIEFPFTVVTLDAYDGFKDAIAGAGSRRTSARDAG